MMYLFTGQSPSHYPFRPYRGCDVQRKEDGHGGYTWHKYAKAWLTLDWREEVPGYLPAEWTATALGWGSTIVGTGPTKSAAAKDLLAQLGCSLRRRN